MAEDVHTKCYRAVSPWVSHAYLVSTIAEYHRTFCWRQWALQSAMPTWSAPLPNTTGHSAEGSELFSQPCLPGQHHCRIPQDILLKAVSSSVSHAYLVSTINKLPGESLMHWCNVWQKRIHTACFRDSPHWHFCILCDLTDVISAKTPHLFSKQQYTKIV